jgi:NADPH-dependent 2,4-dienoyl-CoA reductase/sulfur reductase-like enzyme
MRRILIVGGGTGGTLVANRLRRMLAESEAEITVVDQDERHVYQPGLLFVPFGLADPDEITRPRHRQLHAGIGFRQAAIERVDLGSQTVVLGGGTAFGYDVLVIATSARLLPEETDGLDGGWPERVHTFYTPAGAASLPGCAGAFRGRPDGRQRRRHADQVPGRIRLGAMVRAWGVSRPCQPGTGRKGHTSPLTGPTPSGMNLRSVENSLGARASRTLRQVGRHYPPRMI